MIEAKVVNRGNCMLCGKELSEDEGIFFCKKCATCGCHPYVNWFDRHFCEPYKVESEEC